MKAILACLALVICAASALADTRQDCEQFANPDLQLRACTEIIGRDGKAAWAYTNRGNAYAAKGDHDRAIADYTKAIEIRPKDGSAYLLRGRVRQDRGDYDRAIADYGKAIEFNPKGDAAYDDRGGAHQSKGDFDRAIADFSEVIRLNPSDAGAYNRRGRAYRLKGEHDRAIADFSTAIETVEKEAAAKRGGDSDVYARLKIMTGRINVMLSYSERGASYLAKRDHDRAIADYSRIARGQAGDQHPSGDQEQPCRRRTRRLP